MTWKFASIVWVFVAGFVLYQSVDRLSGVAASADLSDLANSIEGGFQPDEADIDGLSVKVDQTIRSGTCSDTATRSLLTVGLFRLDAAMRSEIFGRIDAAVLEGLQIVRRRLSCVPVDGNAWLRYAMVQARASGPVHDVVSALRLSYRDAPNEFWILEARVRFAMDLFVTGNHVFDAEFADDLRRFVTFEPVDDVATFFVRSTAPVKDKLRPLIVAQGDTRKTWIEAAVGRMGERVETIR